MFHPNHPVSSSMNILSHNAVYNTVSDVARTYRTETGHRGSVRVAGQEVRDERCHPTIRDTLSNIICAVLCRCVLIPQAPAACKWFQLENRANAEAILNSQNC